MLLCSTGEGDGISLTASANSADRNVTHNPAIQRSLPCKSASLVLCFVARYTCWSDRTLIISRVALGDIYGAGVTKPPLCLTGRWLFLKSIVAKYCCETASTL